MRYKVGDKVRIINFHVGCMNSEMDYMKGKIMEISDIHHGCYFMKEDNKKWAWTDEMIAGKIEEEHSSDYYLLKYLSAKLSEKEAELNTKLSEIKKIQEEIKKELDNES